MLDCNDGKEISYY